MSHKELSGDAHVVDDFVYPVSGYVALVSADEEPVVNVLIVLIQIIQRLVEHFDLLFLRMHNDIHPRRLPVVPAKGMFRCAEEKQQLLQVMRQSFVHGNTLQSQIKD